MALTPCCLNICWANLNSGYNTAGRVRHQRSLGFLKVYPPAFAAIRFETSQKCLMQALLTSEHCSGPNGNIGFAHPLKVHLKGATCVGIYLD